MNWQKGNLWKKYFVNNYGKNDNNKRCCQLAYDIAKVFNKQIEEVFSFTED
mgnify:CR=1 FL=1